MIGCDIQFLASGSGLDRTKPIQLHVVWNNLIRERRENPVRPRRICGVCRGPNRVERLEMPDSPWTWFEREKNSPVRPSLTLTLNGPHLQLSYSLRAIIYSGKDHFTLRFRDQSGRWWNHDGQIASGIPQPEVVQSEEELLMNGLRFACIYIYCRDGH
jgi:hypothetical protein